MPADTLEDNKKVKRYDFTRPDKFSKEQIRTFSMTNETFARQLAPVLARNIGTPVDAELAVVDQETYREFVTRLDTYSTFAPIGLDPLRGPALLQVEPRLSRLLIDTACGRPSPLSVAAPIEDRPATELEALALDHVLGSFVPALREAWQPVLDLHPSIKAIHSESKYLQLVPPSEMVISLRIDINSDGVASAINMCVPYITIEPIVPRLSVMYFFGKLRHGSETPQVAEGANGLEVPCELCIPLDDTKLSRLAAIINGDSLPIPPVAAQKPTLHAGGVAVARLNAESVALTDSHLRLPVLERRPDAAAARGTNEHAGGSDKNGEELKTIIAGLSDLRRAVEDLRVEGHAALSEDVDSVAAPRVPEDLALMLAKESPSVIAFVLAAIPPDDAARTLSNLAPELRDRTVVAMNEISAGDRALHGRLLGFLARRARSRQESTVSGGPKAIAEVLNHVPRNVEIAVMERFQREDKPLFESIAQLMFVFEDFVLLDSSAIQKLAERVAPEEWAIALKGVPQNVSKHVYSSFSEDQAAAVEAVEQTLGPVRRSEVEATQREIIEELRQLEEAGEVKIAREDDTLL